MRVKFIQWYLINGDNCMDPLYLAVISIDIKIFWTNKEVLKKLCITLNNVLTFSDRGPETRSEGAEQDRVTGQCEV